MPYRRTVELRTDDLGECMGRMRTWLDERRYEPDVFQYRIDADRVSVQVEFKYEAEAIAFADAFDSDNLSLSTLSPAV